MIKEAYKENSGVPAKQHTGDYSAGKPFYFWEMGIR